MNLLLETIELQNVRTTLQDLDLEALRGSAPLCASDGVRLECGRLAASRWLPTQTSLRETAFAALLGHVQVDVVEALPVVRHLISSTARHSSRSKQRRNSLGMGHLGTDKAGLLTSTS